MRALAQSLFGAPSWYGLPASTPGLGLGTTAYRRPRSLRTMTRAAAAMLVETRPAAEAEMAARRVMGTRLLAYAEAVATDGLVTLPAGAVAGYLRFPVLRAGGVDGVPLRQRALRLGVASSYPLPLTHLRPLRPLKVHHNNGCQGAGELASGLITLPTHSLLTGQDLHQLLGLLSPERVAAPTRTAAVVRALGESRLVFNRSSRHAEQPLVDRVVG